MVYESKLSLWVKYAKFVVLDFCVKLVSKLPKIKVTFTNF